MQLQWLLLDLKVSLLFLENEIYLVNEVLNFCTILTVLFKIYAGCGKLEIVGLVYSESHLERGFWRQNHCQSFALVENSLTITLS